MTKELWHSENKEFVWLAFNKTCSECNCHVEKLKDGVVHHWTYRHYGGIYNVSAKELIELKKISWVCNTCHRAIHEKISIEGTRVLKNVVCKFCGFEVEEGQKLCDSCSDLRDQNLYDNNTYNIE
jgi:hypothetical protein